MTTGRGSASGPTSSIAQYDGFEPRLMPGQHVNGALTVGENIGDLGGLTIALLAYELSLDGERGPVIDGLGGRERLFRNWGLIWRIKTRPELAAQLLTVDPHSPPEFRANIVRNLDEFHETFGDRGRRRRSGSTPRSASASGDAGDQGLTTSVAHLLHSWHGRGRVHENCATRPGRSSTESRLARRSPSRWTVARSPCCPRPDQASMDAAGAVRRPRRHESSRSPSRRRTSPS